MMQTKKKRWPIILGAALCLAVLTWSVKLQQAGYVTYLNSDMASEVILAEHQAQTGSLIDLGWLYSTEIHTLHMNLFYALAFCFTPDYMLVRIIGNTIVFVLGMASLVFLLRTLRFSLGASLLCASLLPVTASALYAANMTIGGYYIIHLPFAFFPLALWLTITQAGKAHGHIPRLLPAFIGYIALCLLMGLLSVRYVLCYVCPMVVVAGLDLVLAPHVERRDVHMQLGLITLCGFAACVLGYAASEVLYPRLFTSGTGSADSFLFNPLNGQMMLHTLSTIFADFLKLLGWRGETPLFSLGGIVNLLILAVLVCGSIMLQRACRRLAAPSCEQTALEQSTPRMRWQLIRYALAALVVNLFCFVLIRGTYLNRYLILAVLFFIPTLPILISEEKNVRLRRLFTLCLCLHLGLSSALLLRETTAQEKQSRLLSADLMHAGEYLMQEGYTHGYGTFWNIRVLQERTQGALTMTCLSISEAETGAPVSLTPDLSRWLEPSEYSELNRIESKTFLLLTREESQRLSHWLLMTGAPILYENDTYTIHGFDSSQQIQTWMLLGKMKLENARFENGVFIMDKGARMRIPTSWREKGDYTLRFFADGAPQADSMVRLYTTSDFTTLKEAVVHAGENSISFTLPRDDKYFLILFVSGSAEMLRLERIELSRTP